MENRAQKQKALESTASRKVENRYDGNLLSTYKEVLTLKDGKVITSDFVKHPGACAIIPITEDTLFAFSKLLINFQLKMYKI